MRLFDLVEFRRVFKGCYVTTPQAHQLDAVAEYVAALRAENARLRAKVETLEHVVKSHVEMPDPDCECPGCWACREESAALDAIANLRAAVRAADAFFAGWKAGARMQWESAYAEYMAARAKCGEVT